MYATLNRLILLMWPVFFMMFSPMSDKEHAIFATGACLTLIVLLAAIRWALSPLFRQIGRSFQDS